MKSSSPTTNTKTSFVAGLGAGMFALFVLFAVALWPAYLGLYLMVAFVEYALRTGSIPFVRTLT